MRLLVIICAVLLAALAGCGGNEDPDGARALLAKLQAANYRSWPRAPGWETRQPTSAPHAEDVDIFVDPKTAKLFADGTKLTSWPVGTTIVKDGWDGDDLEIIAVMEKREDGWYWAEFNGSGKPLFSGRPSICTNCHDGGADFVRAFGFP
jgi:hypothetical protein